MAEKTIYRYALSAAAVIIMLTACGAPRQKSPRPSINAIPDDYKGSLESFYLYTEGIKKLRIQDDSLGAENLFKLAVQKDSLFAPAFYELANMSETVNPQKALEYSRRAMDLDTLNGSYRGQMARLLVMTGAYDDALRMYNTLLKDDPKNPSYYWMLAALYDYRGQPFSSISILDSAEYKMGRIEQLTNYKLELMMRVRAYDKAIDETKTMIAESPYAVENYVVLGDLYARKGNDSLAMANYREALRLDSGKSAALVSMAGFYYDKKDMKSYLSTLNALFETDDFPVEGKITLFKEIENDTELYRNNFMLINSLVKTLSIKYPTNYDVIELYAMHLLRSGEFDTALRLYKNQIETNPANLEPYFAIIDVESYLMRIDSVYKYSEIAIRQFPDNPELLLRKGFAEHYMKRYDEALETYEAAYKASTTDQERSSIAGIIGDMYHEQGNMKKCYRYYNKALKLNPDNESVLNNYAYYLSEENRDLERALQMSRRANELSPSNSTFLDTEAWILYLMGDYAKAKERMQLAISLDSSNSAVLLIHYGDILYALDDYFMAQTYWRKALDRGIDKEEYNARMEWPKK